MNRKNIMVAILLLSIFVLFSGCASPVKPTNTNATSSNTNASIDDTVTGSKTVEIQYIRDESGGISSEGKRAPLFVGDVVDYWYQSFISYDISAIPAGSTIVETKLDFSNYERTNDPFSTLGCLNIYQQDFGSVDPKDFFLGEQTGPLTKWCSEIDLKSSPLKSDKFAKALQSKVGQNRFQVRLQFDKNIDNNKQSDFIDVTYSKLLVTYK